MASRSASSSLRRRFAWTFGTAATVALVSWGSIAAYRSAQRAAPGLVAVDPSARPVNNDVIAPAAGDHQMATTDHGVQLVAYAADRSLTAPKPAEKFHSQRYGYCVSLEDTAWLHWQNLATVVPEAEFGALLGNHGRFLVIPVWLANLDPPPETLDRALLARLSIVQANEPLPDFQSLAHRGAVGHSFQFNRNVAGVENTYHVWILRRDGFAYLAAAWMDRRAGSGDLTALDDVLRRFRSDDEMSVGPRVDELSARERQTHGIVYNDLGLSAFASHSYSGAIECFRAGFALQPDNPSILMNLVSANVELKQYRQALAALEPHISRFPKEPDLWAGRAFLLAEVGEIEAALSAYAALFADGYDAEAPFTQYVTLLAEHGRVREALTAIEHYLRAKESSAVRQLQAQFSGQLGKLEKPSLNRR